MMLLFYVTCSDSKEAEKIAEQLLDEKLIACANILPQMTSVYRWQGQVEKSSEAVLILKSKVDLRKKLQERITALHSYDCPCVLDLTVEGCNAVYAEWLKSQFS